jgi:hypothetical protein
MPSPTQPLVPTPPAVLYVPVAPEDVPEKYKKKGMTLKRKVTASDVPSGSGALFYFLHLAHVDNSNSAGANHRTSSPRPSAPKKAYGH